MRKIVLVAFGVAVVIAFAASVMDLLGFPVSGAGIGGITGGLIGAIMIAGRGSKTCPRCPASLPGVRSPRSFAQAVTGGWTCANCGCEVDRTGKETHAKA